MGLEFQLQLFNSRVSPTIGLLSLIYEIIAKKNNDCILHLENISLCLLKWNSASGLEPRSPHSLSARVYLLVWNLALMV